MKIKIPLTIYHCDASKNAYVRNCDKIAEGNIYDEDNVQLDLTKDGQSQLQYSSIAQLIRMLPNVKRVALVLDTGETDEP